MKILILSAICVLIVGAVAFALFFLNPNRGNFSIQEINVTAQLETDGTLRVVDQRKVSSASDVRNIHWSVNKTSNVSSLKFESVRLIKKDASFLQFSSKRYDYNWTSGLAIDKQTDVKERGTFSFDDVNGIFYLFLSDETCGLEDAVIEVVYSVRNSVFVYDDVAELYWDYYAGDTYQATPNLSLQLALPVPEDDVAKPGSNVWGWGHGPQGLIDFEEGIYLISSSAGKTHAQGRIHVLVDKAWLGNVDTQGEMIAHGARKDYAVSEELKWTDTSTYSAANTQTVNVVLISLAIVVLIISPLTYYSLLRSYTAVAYQEMEIKESFDIRTGKLQNKLLSASVLLLLVGVFGAFTLNGSIGAVVDFVAAIVLFIFANWCPTFNKSWRNAVSVAQK